MKSESKQHKVRVVQDGKTITWGVTIPASFKHWFGVMVTIKESGNAIILESGAIPIPFSSKELKKQALTLETIKF